MLNDEEIARRLAAALYPEEALKARIAALEEAGKRLLDAIGLGVSEYTTLGAAMKELRYLIDK